MPDVEVYKKFFEVMKKRGGPFTGVDIPEFYELVEALFTPEQAEVNNAMPENPATAEEIAEVIGKDAGVVKKILDTMADEGLCSCFKEGDVQYYEGAPFIPGIFEYQFMPGRETDREKKMAAIAAVTYYIKSEQEAAAFAQSQYPDFGTSIAEIKEQQPLVLNLWSISGRQQQMQMRSLMQMKAFQRFKQRV